MFKNELSQTKEVSRQKESVHRKCEVDDSSFEEEYKINQKNTVMYLSPLTATMYVQKRINSKHVTEEEFGRKDYKKPHVQKSWVRQPHFLIRDSSFSPTVNYGIIHL